MNSLLAALLSGNDTGFIAKNSVAFEFGYTEHADPDWDLLENYQGNSAGFRLGHSISPGLELVASYQKKDSSRYGDDYWYWEDEGGSSTSYTGWNRNMTENIVGIGPKVNLAIKPWLVPYATGQAMIVHQKLSLVDAQSDVEDPITMVQDQAFGVGVAGALGLELRTLPIGGKVQLNTFLEYGGVSGPRTNFALSEAGTDGADISIGDLQYGGLQFRMGVGARF